MSDVLKISLGLITILALVALFEVVLPRQAENSIRATALLSDTEFLKTANSETVSRCEFIADKKTVSKLQDISFAKVLFQDREYLYTSRGTRRYRYFWRDIDNKPFDTVLYTSEHHTPVHLSPADIDVGFLPVILKYTNYAWAKQFSSEADKIALLHEFVPKPTYDRKYVIKGLHPNQSVTVIGALEKVDNQYRLRKFKNGLNTAELHPVIVTKFSSADLTNYLENNYMVGKELVNSVQDESHYESEPHL